MGWGIFDDISKAIGTDSDQGALGSVGKSLGLDNDTIKSLRLPALAAGAYFGAPYLMDYFGTAGGAAEGATGGAFNFNPIGGTGSLVDAGSSALGGLGEAISGNKGLGLALGGLLGAAAGGDTTTSTSKDPWAPAQPYLKANLMQNALMQDHYAKNPFSQEQQQQYQGLFNTLANNQAGGNALLGNASKFGQSSRGVLPQMQAMPTGTQAAPIDWNAYKNIGLLKG